MAEIDTKIAIMNNDIKYIKEKIDEISERMDKDYVTKNEFNPVRIIVYGLVGLILTAVIIGIVNIIIR